MRGLALSFVVSSNTELTGGVFVRRGECDGAKRHKRC